jgi:multicomponent Na+:H+ antiporter subunit D
VPPAGGFFGKLTLFQIGIADDGPVLVALIFLGGALSLVYMFQLYRRRFWIAEEADESTTVGALGLVTGLALILIGIGVWPEPLIELTTRASEVLPERLP